MAESRDHERNALLWGTAGAGEERKELRARRLCRQYIERRVSGVFFAPLELTASKDELNEEIVTSLMQAGTAVVLLDRCIYSYPRRSRYDLVGIDNRHAGYVITDHLLSLGSRRISFLARPQSASTVDARISGYREALYDKGNRLEPGLIWRGDPSDIDYIRRQISEWMPDSIVCANDHTAAHLMRTLEEIGKRVPEDLRIAGLDDVKYASLLRVPLTTLRQPCRQIGAVAMSAMLERLEHPDIPARDILLDFELVIRRSTTA